MILPRPQDVNHKTQLFRLLLATLSNATLSSQLVFKGGTYAALRGVLNRFSVDLDFDLPDTTRKDELRDIFYEIFKDLDLEIKDQSNDNLQFFLKYEAFGSTRNTLKLEISDMVSKFNKYENVKLQELGVFCKGHTLDTMFANKLVAATGRFKRNGKIAGRDFYDIHHFFTRGILINKEVVEDLTQQEYSYYLKDFISFIDKYLSDQLLYQDLNPLLPTSELNKSIKYLKSELRLMINDEIKRSIK